MEIENFGEPPEPFWERVSPAKWIGREVREETIDRRVVFIRSVVFSYLYHSIFVPTKLKSFEHRLIHSLWGVESEESYDNRLIFIRQLVINYLHQMVVVPEELEIFEERVVDALFPTDELESPVIV